MNKDGVLGVMLCRGWLCNIHLHTCHKTSAPLIEIAATKLHILIQQPLIFSATFRGLGSKIFVTNFRNTNGGLMKRLVRSEIGYMSSFRTFYVVIPGSFIKYSITSMAYTAHSTFLLGAPESFDRLIVSSSICRPAPDQKPPSVAMP